MNVLLVGRIEPSLARALQAKYRALQLPNDATRADFLAKHRGSITAIIDGGPPGVDADLMEALPNLGAIVHQGAGYDTVDVDAARRLGIGVSNTPEVLNDTVADTAVALCWRRCAACVRQTALSAPDVGLSTAVIR
jgi:lactate dehydrogenase-like 2-hydroxyacid dehydrogenase